MGLSLVGSSAGFNLVGRKATHKKELDATQRAFNRRRTDPKPKEAVLPLEVAPFVTWESTMQTMRWARQESEDL